MKETSTGPLDALYASTEKYYSGKARRCGATPAGVDWPSQRCQELRIAQLLKPFSLSRHCSLNDLGCGYGAAIGVLAQHYPIDEIDYLGIDLSEEMVRLANARWRDRPRSTFIVGHASPRTADYSIASGIFNVKLDHPRDRWEQLVRNTLRDLDSTSRYGFAVNFLTAQANEFGASELYCTQPEVWIDYGKSSLDLTVELVADYGLPEFSLVMRKRSADDRSQTS